MSTSFTIHSKMAQFLPSVSVGFGNEQEAVKRLVEIHNVLISLPTLAPSSKVNTLFEELVALVLANEKDGQRILALPEIASRLNSFRNLCAQGESDLESSCAKRASMASNAKDEVKKHPYYHNYKQLVAVEAEEIRRSASNQVYRVLFVGGGPSPLTPILLAENYGWQIDALDRDLSACEESRELIAKIGLSGMVAITHGDIKEMQDLRAYDCVFLAALVGTTPEEKQEIIEHIANAMRPGAVFITRSAEGLRTLFYLEVNAKAFPTTLEVKRVFWPSKNIINSVVTARKI